MQNGWNSMPLVKLIIPFVLGIILEMYIKSGELINPFYLIALFVFLCIFQIYSHKEKLFKWHFMFGLITYLLLFLLGIYLTSTNTISEKRATRITDKNDVFIAVVDEIPLEKEISYKIVLGQIQQHVRNDTIQIPGKAIMYLKKDSSTQVYPSFGDKILIRGNIRKLNATQNPGEFNYTQYLSDRQIYFQITAKADALKLLSKNEKFSITKSASVVRNKLQAILKECGFDKKELAVVSALMLGIKDGLDQEIKQAYSSSGAMHILAVSGLHVGIIYLVLNFIVGFLDKNQQLKIFKACLIISSLWGYAIITGLSPSVTRATVMFSFVIVGKVFNRDTNIYNTLAASAFLLLLTNPYLIKDVGFQLSYFAVLGIVFFQPKIYNFIIPNSIFIDKIWALISVSIAAQLSTFPLGLFYFHQFPNYFLVSNLFVIPLATIIIYIGITLLLISPFKIALSFVGGLLQSVVSLLNWIVLKIESLPFSIVENVFISSGQTLLIYAIMLLLVLYFVKMHFRYLRNAVLLLLISSFLLLSNTIAIAKTKKIIFYNIKDISAFECIEGYSGVFVADNELFMDNSRLKYHTQAFRSNAGLKKEKFIAIENLQDHFCDTYYFQNGNFMQFFNKRLLIIDDTYNSDLRNNNIDIDYIVLKGNPKVTANELKQKYNPELIIVDASNKNYKAIVWENESKKIGVKCYSVGNSGPLEIDLKEN